MNCQQIRMTTNTNVLEISWRTCWSYMTSAEINNIDVTECCRNLQSKEWKVKASDKALQLKAFKKWKLLLNLTFLPAWLMLFFVCQVNPFISIKKRQIPCSVQHVWFARKKKEKFKINFMFQPNCVRGILHFNLLDLTQMGKLCIHWNVRRVSDWAVEQSFFLF